MPINSIPKPTPAPGIAPANSVVTVLTPMTATVTMAAYATATEPVSFPLIVVTLDAPTNTTKNATAMANKPATATANATEPAIKPANATADATKPEPEPATVMKPAKTAKLSS